MHRDQIERVLDQIERVLDQIKRVPHQITRKRKRTAVLQGSINKGGFPQDHQLTSDHRSESEVK